MHQYFVPRHWSALRIFLRRTVGGRACSLMYHATGIDDTDGGAVVLPDRCVAPPNSAITLRNLHILKELFDVLQLQLQDGLLAACQSRRRST